MPQDNLNGSTSDRRSSGDRRFRYGERSAEEKLLNGEGRFKRQSEIGNVISTANEVSDRRVRNADRRAGSDRRSGTDRRCGFDTRSEVERFMQGERRSRFDRRSRIENGYQSFKKARAFVRSLGLKSVSEWRDYANSDKKPNNVPADPENVYAADGWAGWSDWLRASPNATHLWLYGSFKKMRDFMRRLVFQIRITCFL